MALIERKEKIKKQKPRKNHEKKTLGGNVVLILPPALIQMCFWIIENPIISMQLNPAIPDPRVTEIRQ